MLPRRLRFLPWLPSALRCPSRGADCQLAVCAGSLATSSRTRMMLVKVKVILIYGYYLSNVTTSGPAEAFPVPDLLRGLGRSPHRPLPGIFVRFQDRSTSYDVSKYALMSSCFGVHNRYFGALQVKAMASTVPTCDAIVSAKPIPAMYRPPWGQAWG